MLHAHLHAAADRQLVGVDLRTEAQRGGRCEDAVRILRREEALVAENVHEISEFRRLRQHIHDGLHVRLLRIATAHGVGAQKGGAHRGGNRVADPADDAQHLQLIGRIEPVSALDLDGAAPLPHHLPHAFHRLGEQFVFRSPVQQVGGIQDTPAPSRNLFVAAAFDLVQELAVAAAGVHDVGVAVAEGRHQQAALCVDVLRAGRPLRAVRHRAEARDAAVLDAQPGVAQDARPGHLRAALAHHARRNDADQLAYILDNHRYSSLRINSTDFSISGCI